MKNIFNLALLLLVVACAGPKALENKINKNQYYLGYLHDSPKAKVKKTVNIIPVINYKADSTKNTSVRKIDGSNIWIVIAHYYDYDYIIKFGSNSSYPDISTFVRNSFCNESKRSGEYYVDSTGVNKSYRVEINMDAIDVSTKYHESLSAGGGTTQKVVEVKPPTGRLNVEVDFVEGSSGKLIYNKKYKSRIKGSMVTSKYYSQSQINKAMMNSMTDVVSKNIKHVIKNIVKDINAELNKLKLADNVSR